MSGQGALQPCAARRCQPLLHPVHHLLRDAASEPPQPAVHGGIRPPAARRRPIARRFVVQRPHPYLVAGAFGKSGERGRRRDAVVLPIDPVTRGALAILDVVVRQRRAAVEVRCRPGHQQTGVRSIGCADRRRRRRRRRFGCVSDVDGYANRAAGAERIRRLYGHGIGRLHLVVVAHTRPGLDLATLGVDVERPGVRPSERVRQWVAVGVRCRHRRPDGLARRRVLGETAAVGRARKDRCAVVRPPAARRRPVAMQLAVECPHPHLVVRVRSEAGDRGRGTDGCLHLHLGVTEWPAARHRGRSTDAIVRPRDPVAAVHLAICHVIIRDWRAAIEVRRRPVHQQAGARSFRRPHGRRVRRRRFLGHVGDVDGYGNGTAGMARIARRHRDRVGIFGLVVVGHAGLGPDLAALGLDVERCSVRSSERVGQWVAVGVRRRYRRPDGLARRRVFREAASGFSIREGRRRLVRPPAARRRPVAVPLVIPRQHPHLIAGMRRKTRDRRGGAGAVVRPVAPVAARTLPIFDVVVRQRRTAKGVRRRPGRQKGGA